ncbi:MAG TPA: hypothetical protein VN947_28035 [Polyangia bacterium]|nr:hypothetical protein [Polyangia bacterium]
MKPSILAAALVAATGCATTSGSTTASHYTGYPYNISDDGKRISGLVCGVGVDYSVEQHGDLTRVTGFGLHSQSFEVRPALDGWHVMGSLGTGPAAGELDVLVTPTAVRGRAGLRDVWLQAVNDEYQGRYTVRNRIGASPMVVEGRTELMKLPPAELAALVPGILNCEATPGKPVIQGAVAVRFGGPPGYETREVNQLR